MASKERIQAIQAWKEAGHATSDRTSPIIYFFEMRHKDKKLTGMIESDYYGRPKIIIPTNPNWDREHLMDLEIKREIQGRMALSNL